MHALSLYIRQIEEERTTVIRLEAYGIIRYAWRDLATHLDGYECKSKRCRARSRAADVASPDFVGEQETRLKSNVAFDVDEQAQDVT